jgi:hypothetical protein
MANNKNKLAIDDIPLPPDPDFDDEQAGEEAQAAKVEDVKKTAAEEPAQMPSATLDFVDDNGIDVPLKHKFRRDGEIVSKFTCHPLTLGQVQDLTRQAQREDGIELVSVYALIARTDVATLRGLKEVDGNAVVEAARDFLPRAFRGSANSE